MKVTVKKKSDAIPVIISTEYIKLEAAMKLANAVPSGGVAKNYILDGEALVNGQVCLMRGKKLYNGDTFSFMDQTYLISYHS